MFKHIQHEKRSTLKVHNNQQDNVRTCNIKCKNHIEMRRCEFHVTVPRRTCLWEVLLSFKRDRFYFPKTHQKSDEHQFLFFSFFLSFFFFSIFFRSNMHAKKILFWEPPLFLFLFFSISFFFFFFLPCSLESSPLPILTLFHKKSLPLSFLKNSGDSPSNSLFSHAKNAKKYEIENL